MGKCCTHYLTIFKKSTMNILKIDLFYLPSATSEKNAFRLSWRVTSIPTLAQRKSTRSWPSLGPTNKWCCAHTHHPPPPPQSWFYCVLGCFCEVFNDVFSRYLGQWSQINLHWKPHPSAISVEKLRAIGDQMHPQPPLISVKIFFVGNRVEAVILAAMGQYIFHLIFFVHCLFVSFLGGFFGRKRYFCFFLFFQFFLF